MKQFSCPQVLRLNKLWHVINVTNIEKALTGLYKGVYSALNICDGEVIPCDFEQWMKLPIREQDDYLSTPNYKIRIPTVIISKNYDKIPMIEPALTKRAIFQRDNYICQYTGRQLTREEVSVDHIIPKSKNGKDDWTNMVTCDKHINRKKGNKSIKEMGLKLIKEPKKPHLHFSPAKIKMMHKDWEMFLIK